MELRLDGLAAGSTALPRGPCNALDAGDTVTCKELANRLLLDVDYALDVAGLAMRQRAAPILQLVSRVGTLAGTGGTGWARPVALLSRKWNLGKMGDRLGHLENRYQRRTAGGRGRSVAQAFE